VAEFNILCDPEAAQIVLNTPVPKTMIPLNVTHKAIVTSSVHAKLIDSTAFEAPSGAPTSRLRHTLSTLISFFKDTYESTFGFMDGPPLHDALTIAYVSRPELFTGIRYRVDVELTGAHSSGQTVADVWGYLKLDDTWGRTGKNCEDRGILRVVPRLRCKMRRGITAESWVQTRVMRYNMSSQYVNTKNV